MKNSLWSRGVSYLLIGGVGILAIVSFQNCSKPAFSQSDAGSTSLLSTGGADDFVPNAFSFADQVGVGQQVAAISNSVRLTGDGFQPVSARCINCQIQVNGSGPFTELISQISPGDSIVIRTTSSPSPSTTVVATVQVGAVTSAPWRVTTKSAANQCAVNVGQSCQITSQRVLSGCQENYGCVDFVGIYYNSPGGCNGSSAQSFIEYYFDGVNMRYTGLNSAGERGTGSIIGGASSAYHCTYVGYAYYDPFKGKPDGACHSASAGGYGIPNTYTRVVPGTGCTHAESVVTGTGTVQCDGSCR